MTLKELVNAICNDLEQEAEHDHRGNEHFVWIEKKRQEWLKMVEET